MKMNIPQRDWNYHDWIKYIIDNKQQVFSSRKENMLKVYFIHTNTETKKKLIENSSQQGQFHVISMEYDDSATRNKIQSEYWLHEREPGLLMFFTASTQEGYEKTLRQKIKRMYGLYEMWIKPETFKKIRTDLVTEKKCGIVKFFAQKKKYDKSESYVKEKAERWIHYHTTNRYDGINRLQEMEYHLGVTAKSIEYIYEGSRIQITTEGLFHLKKITEKSFELMDFVIEKIRREESQMRNITQEIFLEKEQDKDIDQIVISPGKIELGKDQDSESAMQIVQQLKADFIFSDVNIIDEPFFLSSEVVDRYKGSVFSISAFENNIIIIPRYHVTFETFLGFYKEIVESIDEKAKILSYSETLIE